jgi:hypothetical protein
MMMDRENLQISSPIQGPKKISKDSRTSSKYPSEISQAPGVDSMMVAGAARTLARRPGRFMHTDREDEAGWYQENGETQL